LGGRCNKTKSRRITKRPRIGRSKKDFKPYNTKEKDYGNNESTRDSTSDPRGREGGGTRNGRGQGHGKGDPQRKGDCRAPGLSLKSRAVESTKKGKYHGRRITSNLPYNQGVREDVERSEGQAFTRKAEKKGKKLLEKQRTADERRERKTEIKTWKKRIGGKHTA